MLLTGLVFPALLARYKSFDLAISTAHILQCTAIAVVIVVLLGVGRNSNEDLGRRNDYRSLRFLFLASSLPVASNAERSQDSRCGAQ